MVCGRHSVFAEVCAVFLTSYVQKLERLASLVSINDLGVYGRMCVGVCKGGGVVLGHIQFAGSYENTHRA